MTKAEKKLLDDLKDFFSKKYKTEWKSKFIKYTNKLVIDNDIDRSVINDYLEDEEDDEPANIVKKFKEFKSKSTTSRSSSSDGCGSSRSSC